MKPRKNSSSIRWQSCWIAAFVVILLLPFLTPTSARSQPAAKIKRVLVLHWYDREFIGTSRWDQNFRASLQAEAGDAIECYSEYLEVNRFSGEQQAQALHDYLRRKYADHPIDIVIAQSHTALNYLLKYRDDLFPNIPVVFYMMSRPNAEQLAAKPDLTGLVVFADYRKSLDVALGLHPQTEQVFIISGTLERNGHFEKIVRDELKDYENRARINYLTDLPLDELVSKTRSLPPRSIVLYIWQQSRNEQGKILETAEVFDSIVRTTPAPIYCMSGPIVERGALGGYVYTPESSAAKMAEIVRRIAGGERVQDIQIENAPRAPMFNWRELRRWNISEDSLPPGSVIRFKERTVWDLYKWYIIGIISLCLLEAALIAYLLVAHARRRRAERERERFARLADAEHKHLDETVSNVPGIVWETLIDPETNIRKTTFISDYVEKMLGYTSEEWLAAKPGFGYNIMPVEEDKERAKRDSEAVIKSGKGRVTQYRWQAKDGRILWVESSMSPTVDENGKTIGLRGVTLDITEKKLADEARRQSEERSRAILHAIPDLMFLQTRDGVFLDFHVKDAADLFAPPEAFLGKNMRDVLPPELAESFLPYFKRAEETGAPQVLEYKLKMGNEERWFESRIVSSDGKILSIVRDVTERKRADEHLRESEERFRTLADGVPVLIWVNGLNGCEFVNRSYLEYLGRSMDEVLSMDWAAALHPEDAELYITTYLHAFERRAPFEAQFRFRRADGEYHWFKSIGLPRLTLDGKFLGYVGSSVDITDIKNSEEALRLAFEEVHRLKNQLHEENIYFQEEIKLEHNFSEIVGHSDAIKYVLHKIEQVAPTDSTVLIMGETGTGKELVARAIHSASLRHERPLVKVNCAALSAGLIESELFGHEKGAFTGATARKVGRFELAHRATIFLDEIGELPPELQVKLLRVIQEGEFERLGGSRTIKVDVRIIAATNRNLWNEVQKGLFREDLWYRLNVFPITTPPLRQRREDIPLLVEHFVSRFAKKLGRKVTAVAPATLNALSHYSWPGNVRELANVIERAVINNGGSVLRLAHSLESLQAEELSASKKTLEEMERDYIIAVLDETAWRIEGSHGAARILGLHPSTLRTRMAKLKIQKPHPGVVSDAGFPPRQRPS